MTPVPAAWELRPLTDIADVRLGRQRSPKNHSGTQMRPYLRAANVDWSGLKLDDVNQMNFTDEEMQTYRLEPGDIVLGEASGSPGEVGKPALWAGQIDNCAFQNTLIRVRSRGPEPRYLLHYFRYLAQSGAFASESRGVGIHHIGRTKLASWPVPVPPIEEQRRIVDLLDDHLSRLDAAERNLESVLRRLGSLERVGLEAITRRNAEAHVPLSALVERIETGKSFGSASRQARDDEWGIVKVSAMTWGEFRSRENKVVTDTTRVDPRHEIKAGDVLVSRANTTEYVGAPVFVGETRGRLLLSDKSLRLVPRQDVYAPYLHCVLSAPDARAQISARATGTKDSMRNIAQTALMAISVPSAPLNVQHAVAAEVAALQDDIGRIRATTRIAKDRSDLLRRALLASAFTGRLVPGAPNAQESREPADV